MNYTLLCISSCASVTMVSCDLLTHRPTDPEILRLRSLHEAQSNYQKRLKLLPTLNESQLAAELEKDSLENKEPWNSMAFDEATKRIEHDPGFATRLTPFVNKSDRSALLGLLAIRRAAPSAYKNVGSPQSRTEVLVDALRHSKTFNLWGLPHLGLKDASQALIEENSTAAKALIPLLDDKSAAPAWGSSYVQESKRYQYTVGDYALAISKGIEAKRQGAEHKKIFLPKNPAERQKHIELYKKNFDMHSVTPERATPASPATQPDVISPAPPDGLRVN